MSIRHPTSPPSSDWPIPKFSTLNLPLPLTSPQHRSVTYRTRRRSLWISSEAGDRGTDGSGRAQLDTPYPPPTPNHERPPPAPNNPPVSQCASDRGELVATIEAIPASVGRPRWPGRQRLCASRRGRKPGPRKGSRPRALRHPHSPPTNKTPNSPLRLRARPKEGERNQ